MSSNDPRRSPRSARSAARFLLPAGSVALVLGVAEIAVRIAIGTPWYERLPEEQNRQPADRFDVDEWSLPLRHPPHSPPKPTGTRRILFLGDSFTYGVGVAENYTFVSLLGETLNGGAPESGGQRYQLYNGGIPNSLTGDWAHLFDAMAEDYQPDWVVVVFFLRDGVSGVTSVGQINEIRRRMNHLSRESLLHRHSRLLRFFRDRRAQQQLSAEYLAKLEVGYLGGPEATREWMRAQSNLRYIRDQSRRLAARFALVVFPVLFGLDRTYPLADTVDAITRFGDELGVPTLSLLPAFAGRSAPELWVSPLDQHPNEEGHRIAARAIYQFLEPLEAEDLSRLR